MGDMTDREKSFYKLLFEENKNANEASLELEKSGIMATPAQLRQYKTTLYEKIDREVRNERMMENMLESFDRTKIEFEDSVKRLKRWIDDFDSRGETEQAMDANRDLLNHIALSLKVLGKIQNQMTTIQAKNVNIVSQDFVEAFKTMQERFFEDMGAEVENGTLVFKKPSPELMDDYNRWLSKAKHQKALNGPIRT